MRVLAVDTALSACSVAVVETAEADALAHVSSIAMARGHAEALMPEVARVLEAAGGLEGIERVAVTVGPGSFTGLRVGLACARAIGLGAKIPVVGVTTLSALAAPWLALGDGATPVAVAIDARHERVFFQAFSADGRPLVTARLIEARDAARALGDGAAILVGSGAALVAAHAPPSARMVAGDAPDPLWVARLGAACDAPTSAPKPLYLKAADAHPQTQGRIARR
ncbi:tRNA (adenosine(37)-N6)-threonylcarbamoyltransferase complex dimerization subunit type 1 TsaB [Chenggangzhangella methanolivorans]|uniref:tRNA (Adenosine(37)-N6)-threonylcarbamoyltransferase complex dimerization subunit type 1 TsaB n=1 Tax=Chenggangzhangella methanolivorans TaxID=1437009 RepID=A0A9E6RCS1_9HYPH|nr:tRNA (adenosine(37)-N6)-threonylcarbamoyltransferase complex dimerization subunit type 1 TsaB [Chenggangzhangella methanolivorans]QZO01902.1 tRNA (adenosine(37)-N6)-threonylcarbamoyltransferase complex dimerization subunit type 1 TsaB [Chenggangzhangella methanolivorans]